MALLLLLNMAMASGAKVRPFVFPDPNTIVPEVEGINTFERLSPVATTTKHVVDTQKGFVAPVYDDPPKKVSPFLTSKSQASSRFLQSNTNANTDKSNSNSELKPIPFPDPNAIVPVVEGINVFDRMAPVATTIRKSLSTQEGLVHPVYIEPELPVVPAMDPRRQPQVAVVVKPAVPVGH
ncbi:hypothetical protein AAMO2058_001296300 [Amorphochlora amoebiformis]